MASILKADTVQTQTGSSTFNLGASGDTIKIASGSPGADKVLTSDASGNASWAAAAGASNVPAFSVYVDAPWDLGDATWTIAAFDTEDINDDGASGDCFNITGSGTNPRAFTVPTGEGGVYLLTYNITLYSISGGINDAGVTLTKNGVNEYQATFWAEHGSGGSNSPYITGAIATLMNLAADDYIGIKVYNALGSTSGRVSGGRKGCSFSGFKLL
jgi:hypothetical protein